MDRRGLGYADEVKTFAVNVHSQFYLSKAAAPHMKPGSCIINTSSVNSKHPLPGLLAYSATKGAIANFTIGLAQMLRTGSGLSCRQ